MGQYHWPAILCKNHKTAKPKNKVIATLSPYRYETAAKLTEWSFIGTYYTGAIESLINDETGMYSGYPFVVCGDYADKDVYKGETDDRTLYSYLRDEKNKRVRHFDNLPERVCKHYRYIINHTTKEYFDTARVVRGEYGWRIHPLMLLCDEGNGRGSGDYHRGNQDKVGIWARNRISVTDKLESYKGFKEVFVDFKE